MGKLETYIKKLIDQKKIELRLPTLTYRQGPPSLENSHYTVGFKEQIFGSLHIPALERPSSTTNQMLEDFASQLACLLHSQKSPSQIIAIDEFVAKLASENTNRFHWTGVYLLSGQIGLLEVAAFRGEKTPHLVIPVDSGICGATVREKKTLNISDVASDSRYLSCSIKTKSEIVVPIFASDKGSLQENVVGEIDIDSHLKNTFTKDDENSLAEHAIYLSHILSATN